MQATRTTIENYSKCRSTMMVLLELALHFLDEVGYYQVPAHGTHISSHPLLPAKGTRHRHRLGYQASRDKLPPPHRVFCKHSRYIGFRRYIARMLVLVLVCISKLKGRRPTASRSGRMFFLSFTAALCFVLVLFLRWKLKLNSNSSSLCAGR